MTENTQSNRSHAESGSVTLDIRGKKKEFSVSRKVDVRVMEGTETKTLVFLEGTDPDSFESQKAQKKLVDLARFVINPDGLRLNNALKARAKDLKAEFGSRLRKNVLFLPDKNVSLIYKRGQGQVYVLQGDQRPSFFPKILNLSALLVVPSTLFVSMFGRTSGEETVKSPPKYSLRDLAKKEPFVKSSDADTVSNNQPAPADSGSLVKKTQDISPYQWVNPQTRGPTTSDVGNIVTTMDCASVSASGANFALLSPHAQIQEVGSTQAPAPLIGMSPDTASQMIRSDNPRITMTLPGQDSGAGHVYFPKVATYPEMVEMLNDMGLGPRHVTWNESNYDSRTLKAAEKFMNGITCSGNIVDGRIVAHTETDSSAMGGVFPQDFSLTQIYLSTSSRYSDSIIQEHNLQENLHQNAVIVLKFHRGENGETAVWIGNTVAPQKDTNMHLTNQTLKEAVAFAQAKGNLSQDHGKGPVAPPEIWSPAIIVPIQPQTETGDVPPVQSVSEPATLALVALGVAFMVAKSRGRQRPSNRPIPDTQKPEARSLSL